MDVKKFGSFIVAVGVLVLCVALYFLFEAKGMDRALENEASKYMDYKLVGMYMDRPLLHKHDGLMEKFKILSIAGGSVLVLGIGLAISAKKPVSN